MFATATSRRPVMLRGVLPDADLVRMLVETHAPYWPTQRYFSNTAEFAAVSGEDDVVEMPVVSLFRGDWAYDEPLVDGVEPLFHHDAFIAAAREVFGGEVVRPQSLYVNLTYQLPFAQGRGHTDVPAFRGFDRSRYPIVFLSIMGHSGLFEDVRVPIATAVSWFYRGQDGGFEYWPDGPDAPSHVHEGDIHNTAIVADNEVLWHRARGVGRLEDGMVQGLTRDGSLDRDGDDWVIRDGDQVLARLPFEALRISVSWKAYVFASEDEAASYDAGEGGIDEATVLARIAADLAARGIEIDIPTDDPFRDPRFVETLQQVYVTEPAAELL
jgi:hypothetical protein